MPKISHLETGDGKQELQDKYFVNVRICNYPDDPEGKRILVLSGTGSTEDDALRAAEKIRDDHFAFHVATDFPRCTATLDPIQLIAPES